MNVQMLSIADDRYPDLLRNSIDPPQALYYVGNLDALQRPRCAVVGTRRMSSSGESQAFRFGKELSEQGVCVVSGLAYGIDKSAHEGALMGEGGTIAVLAQGLDVLQPTAHLGLAERIVKHGGLLLSEKAPGKTGFKSDYLVRNRIIAGLCKLTLVVEAPFKSGAMNTAKHAMDNGREVFCLPGRITDEMSQGSNYLLQNGAGVALSPKDLLEELGLNWQPKVIPLSGLPAQVFAVIEKNPHSPAELGEQFQQLSELYSALDELERKGLIRFTKDLRYTASSGVVSSGNVQRSAASFS